MIYRDGERKRERERERCFLRTQYKKFDDLRNMSKNKNAFFNVILTLRIRYVTSKECSVLFIIFTRYNALYDTHRIHNHFTGPL